MIVISDNVNKINSSDNFQDAVLRINLAWYSNLEEAEKIILESDRDIMLDFPKGRKKYPVTNHKISDVLKLAEHKNVKFLAVSNIESPEDLKHFIVSNSTLEIIPKIETIKGINNFNKINCQIAMLDHDDLWRDCLKNNKTTDQYLSLIKKLESLCKTRKAILLKTVGVVFFGAV